MTFIPDRKPMITFGNATAEEGTHDPLGRSALYLHDPVGWVREKFQIAKTLGFQSIRFHKPDGHDRMIPDGLYRAGVFLDQDAQDAVYEETERFVAGGGKVCCYTGRISPRTGVAITPTEADEIFSTWIDYGLSRVEFDNTAAIPAEQLILCEWAWGKGIVSGGEYYPIKQISGGQWVLSSLHIHTCPWVILGASARALDPRFLWRVNPLTSELRQFVWQGDFSFVDECVAYIRRVKAIGQIVDQHESDGIHPEVTREILGEL